MLAAFANVVNSKEHLFVDLAITWLSQRVIAGPTNLSGCRPVAIAVL